MRDRLFRIAVTIAMAYGLGMALNQLFATERLTSAVRTVSSAY